MIKIPNRLILIVVIIGIFFPYEIIAEHAIAWINDGYKNCKIVRFRNGEFEEIQAEKNIALYPGDTVYKKNSIKSVKFSFFPYCEPFIKDNSTAIIINNAPRNKESIIKKVLDWFELTKTKYKANLGWSRSAFGKEPSYLENATLMVGEKIKFGDYYKRKTIVFKELDGEEIFKTTFANNVTNLFPNRIGLKHGKTYILEIYRQDSLLWNSLIRIMNKDDEEVTKKAIISIEKEKITDVQKQIRKAAYFQMISDLYPKDIDLYWLSLQTLEKVDYKESVLLNDYLILLSNYFSSLNKGIKAIDFEYIDAPGCILTLELKRSGNIRFVNPNFHFNDGDIFKFHFQTNFVGYYSLIYKNEERDQFQLIFPYKNQGYFIKPMENHVTEEYELYGSPSNEEYFFLFSKNPIKEIDELLNLLEKYSQTDNNQFREKRQRQLTHLINRTLIEGKKIDIKLIGTKAFVKASEANINDIAWFHVSLKNIAKK